MMASEPFVFDGRSLHVWDRFTATPEEAVELERRRYAVTLPHRYQTADVPVEPTTAPLPAVAEPEKKRRRYRRRDLNAEPK